MKIIVGLDGSPSSERAVDWCAQHARQLEGEVIAVHSMDVPYATPGIAYVTIPAPSEEQRSALERTIAQDWCAALTRADVAFRIVLTEGSAAQAIIELARVENADLVVTGRRGQGGFAELLLGSTSNSLAHHLKRPLLIVP